MTSVDESSAELQSRASMRSPRSFVPRFGLRSLLIFAVIFCLFFGWVGRNFVRVREEDAAIETLNRAGATFSSRLDAMPDFRSGSPDWPNAPDDRSPSQRLTDQALRSIGWRKRPAIDRVSLGTWSSDSQEMQDALAALPALPEIRKLALDGEAYDDSSIETLGRLPRLDSLELSSTAITGEGLAKLRASGRLRELLLSHSNGRTKICDGVHWLTELRSLTVAYQDLTQEDVVSIAMLPKLERLDLYTATAIGEDVFAPLMYAESLQELYLASGDADGFDAGDLIALEDLPNLRNLWLDGMSEADLAAFDPPPALRSLWMTRGCEPAAARRFAAMKGVPVEAAQAFSAKHPQCEIHHRGKQGPDRCYLGGEQIDPAKRSPSPDAT